MLSFGTLMLMILPAMFPFFDLSSQQTANIGSTIGGITAPVLSIFSSYLLYMALTRQTESNIDQRLKNESDIIFLLLNQLDQELANFYLKQKQGNIELKLTGLEALNDFGRGYRYDYNIDQFADDGRTFKIWYEAGQIAVIIDTYNLIEKRIEISNLNSETKDLFLLKLDSYYQGKLELPFTSLSEAFDIYPHQKDDFTDKIQKLVHKKMSIIS